MNKKVIESLSDEELLQDIDEDSEDEEQSVLTNVKRVYLLLQDYLSQYKSCL